MSKVKMEQIVEAPLAQAWASWDKFGDIKDFHPGLQDSSLLEGSAPTGVGAKRRCDFTGGKNYILEEITGYIPERELSLKIYDGNIPVKAGFLTLRLEPITPTRTKILVELDFVMKFGAIGSLMKPIMRGQFRKALAGLLEANAKHVEAQTALAA